MNGTDVHVIGGGPAGATSALAALAEGASVKVYEKSRFPRHKVCGEFLSPGAVEILERFGLVDAFHNIGPAVIRRTLLHFGTRSKRFVLPEPAWGISRFALDDFLLQNAVARGAHLVREAADTAPKPLIMARGRHFPSAKDGRSTRLFGFKAHFLGPLNDAVELFFFSGCYVWVNSVEMGVTNVCGIGPERLLRKFAFHHDELINSAPALRARLAPLTRTMSWLSVGPLRFENRFRVPAEEGIFRVGDALSFVDPFTGSGLTAALATGALAGHYAALGKSSAEYATASRVALGRPFQVSSLLRWAVREGWAEHLAPFIPGPLLFRWTRPYVA